jgi:hypothetical protein
MMRIPRLGLAVVVGASVLASLASAPQAAALPDCGLIAPQTMQCERGGHTSINTSPNVTVNNGPYIEQPWINPGYPVVGIGGWAVP